MADRYEEQYFGLDKSFQEFYIEGGLCQTFFSLLSLQFAKRPILDPVFQVDSISTKAITLLSP